MTKLHDAPFARLQDGKMRTDRAAKVDAVATLLELEHQAEHWDTPDHGQTGHLIAQALRAAVAIARAGGLNCEHRLNAQPNDANGAGRTSHRRAKPPKRTNRPAPTPT